MKTKYFAVLALAGALLVGGPAFGYEKHGGGGKGHSVAVVHRSGGVRSVAVVHRRSGGTRVAVSHSRTYHGATVATRRRSVHSRSSVALAGRTYNSGGRAHYKYAFQSHAGWDPGHEYYWNGHHYRWYGNGWFIIDPLAYSYQPAYGYYSGGSVTVAVQTQLIREGYYQGPVDGVVGPNTQGAIAAYQREHGLRVTGTINIELLSSLGLG